MKYVSSVLTCNVGDCDCLVCAFLNGDTSEVAMLEVIRILDAKLAEEETVVRQLTRSLVERN